MASSSWRERKREAKKGREGIQTTAETRIWSAMGGARGADGDNAAREKAQRAGKEWRMGGEGGESAGRESAQLQLITNNRLFYAAKSAADCGDFCLLCKRRRSSDHEEIASNFLLLHVVVVVVVVVQHTKLVAAVAAAVVVVVIVVVVGHAHKSLHKLRKFHLHTHTRCQRIASVVTLQHWPRSTLEVKAAAATSQRKLAVPHTPHTQSTHTVHTHSQHGEFTIMRILLDSFAPLTPTQPALRSPSQPPRRSRPLYAPFDTPPSAVSAFSARTRFLFKFSKALPFAICCLSSVSVRECVCKRVCTCVYMWMYECVSVFQEGNVFAPLEVFDVCEIVALA